MTTLPATPDVEARLAAVETLLQSVEAMLHRVHRVVEGCGNSPVLTARDAARLTGKAVKTLGNLQRRGVLTDPRPRKVAGSPLLFLADEIEILRRGDGEAGLIRHRKQKGRA